MSETGTPAAGSPDYIVIAKNGIALLAQVAMAIDPELKIAGLAVGEVASIASGIVDGAPSVVNAWKDITAATNGGAAPTPEQIAALRQSVDAAAAEIDAEVKAEDAAGKA